MSLVKLTDKPSNFLTTIDSTVLESLYIYIWFVKDFAGPLVYHIFFFNISQGCQWITTSVFWGACGSWFLHPSVNNLAICFGSYSCQKIHNCFCFVFLFFVCLFFFKENRCGLLETDISLISNFLLELLQ